jgi:NTE family protein
VRTAFVLSGGANLGCVQVGMVRALRDAGVLPDLVVGASAGAINAGWIAADPGGGRIDELAEIWVGLKRTDVFPLRLGLGLRGFLGHRNHLVPNTGIRTLLGKHLRFERLEQAAIPLYVIVTDARTGQEERLSWGNTIDAITASASIPGLLPPVVIGDRAFVDGGVANNTPISHAVELGAERVIVLPAAYSCALPEPPGGALAVAVHAVGLLVHRRLAFDVERYASSCSMHVIPPLCPLAVPPLDFGHARELMARAEAGTRSWIAAGGLEHPHPSLMPTHGH